MVPVDQNVPTLEHMLTCDGGVPLDRFPAIVSLVVDSISLSPQLVSKMILILATKNTWKHGYWEYIRGLRYADRSGSMMEFVPVWPARIKPRQGLWELVGSQDEYSNKGFRSKFVIWVIRSTEGSEDKWSAKVGLPISPVKTTLYVSHFDQLSPSSSPSESTIQDVDLNSMHPYMIPFFLNILVSYSPLSGGRD